MIVSVTGYPCFDVSRITSLKELQHSTFASIITKNFMAGLVLYLHFQILSQNQLLPIQQGIIVTFIFGPKASQYFAVKYCTKRYVDPLLTHRAESHPGGNAGCLRA